MVVLTLLILYVPRAFGVEIPLLVAALFAVLIALPVSLVLFASLRRRVNEGIAAVDERRRPTRRPREAHARRERAVTATGAVVDRSAPRDWVDNAVRLIEADAQRSADTHLLRYPLPADWGIDLYLKDESTHITGSLKHRLARSLFLYALCNGWIREGTPIIEASSGSTAVSEAYFARLLGLDFVAVVPRRTSPAKVALIEAQGGRCHYIDRPPEIYTEAQRLADELGGCFMDQFTNAERVTDWRGNNNIAESIYSQMRLERHPVPEWIVVGAGTGGTSATLGRYIRYRRHRTRLAVVDPENSAFFGGFETGSADYATGMPRASRGSGVRASSRPSCPRSSTGWCGCPTRRPSPPCGTRVPRSDVRWAARPARTSGEPSADREMLAEGREGSVVTLLCDGGERYADTYFSDEWVAAEGMDLAGPLAVLEKFATTGGWPR